MSHAVASPLTSRRRQSIALAITLALLVAAWPTPAASAGPDPVTCTGYPEPRVFLESQDWWQPTVSGNENFGHVHSGACFPRTHLPDGRVNPVKGTLRLDVRVMLHDNPGTLRFARVHLSGDGYNTEVAKVSIGERCVRGGPRWVEATAGCVWLVPLTIDTTRARYDGYQEFRVSANVRHDNAGADTQFSSSGWQAYLANGKTVRHYRRNGDGSPRDYIEGRGWYEGALYTNARLQSRLPYTVSGTWSPKVHMAKGSGGVDVTRAFASIDPDFHHGSAGQVLLNRNGSYSGTVSIDTRKLSNGPHKLFLRADAPCDGTAGNDCGRKADGSSNNVSTNSGAMAVTFIVNN